MSKEDDYLSGDVACLLGQRVQASLVATHGAYSEVWRSAGTVRRDGVTSHLDFVIKRYRGPCSLPEVRSLARHYRDLRTELGEIVPAALFIATAIDGAPGLCVLAETVKVWFNLAHPGNEEEALPLLAGLPVAVRQLEQFVAAARRWRHSENPRVIDLYGTDNLVLDINRDVRYLDSFHVFFFEDMLHALEEVDLRLKERIETSLERLEYLERLVGLSRRGDAGR